MVQEAHGACLQLGSVCQWSKCIRPYIFLTSANLDQAQYLTALGNYIWLNDIMIDSSDLTFFFGAGASAPFGIPTMKQLVADFEKYLEDEGSEEEKNLFSDIKNTLEKTLRRQVDLEDVFTVIDGIMNYGFDRIGLVSLYTLMKEFSRIPSPEVAENVCSTLRKKFEEFIREKCLIPEGSYDNISTVYKDLFNQIEKTSGVGGSQHPRRIDFGWCSTWTMFTTNYDICIEFFWRESMRISLHTGFAEDPARHTQTLRSGALGVEALTLVKLHGSVNWMIEPDGTVIEEQSIPARSLVGRRYVRPMMIYPIQQKELYVEPYISMFLQLNRELERKTNWVVIGYSFNDPIIREIFVKNTDKTKQIVLVHPHANDIADGILRPVKDKCREFSPLNKKFGLRHRDYNTVNEEIVKCLV